MRKVALHGSYFGYNFGDTLLCALFCNWIHRSRPGAHVVLPLASRRNLKLIGADSRGVLAFLSCSDLIMCGGGYFGDSGSRSMKWTFRNYLRHFVIAELAILLRKRVYILGTGVGPISSPFLRKRLKRIVNYAQCTIVRDVESRIFLTELGVSKVPELDVDAALYLTRDFITADTDAASNPWLPETVWPNWTLAIHLSDFGAEDWSAMAESVVSFCLKHENVTPLLITDSVTRTGKAAAQDQASRRLEKLLPSALRVDYGGDPRDLCRLLDTANLVVTNKLHVGIVSSVLGKGVISLPQHVKTPRFYRQIEMSEVCVTADRAEGLDKLLALWESGNFPRLSLTSRQNVYLDVIKDSLGAG